MSATQLGTFEFTHNFIFKYTLRLFHGSYLSVHDFDAQGDGFDFQRIQRVKFDGLYRFCTHPSSET